MRQLRPTISAVLVLAGSLPALAQGCGPTRLKASESVTLDLSPQQAWAKLGDFQDMSWDAESTGASGSGGNVPGKAKRAVTMKNGMTLDESLYRYDPGAMSYAYHVDHVDVIKLPVQNASATFEVLPGNEATKSVVRWKFAFYRNLAPGEGAADAADTRAVEAMRRYMRAGLAGLETRATPRT